MCVFTATTIATTLGVSAGVAQALAIAGNVAMGLSIASGLAGGTVGTVSSIQQGKATQAQYDYQAKVAQNNAKIAEENARRTRQQGIEEERLQRIKTQRNVASQMSSMASNGIDVTQGTAVDVLADTSAMGELDALQTRYNYEAKAQGYDVEAGNFKNQSNLDMLAGRNAYSAGIMGGISEGLAGIGKTADVATRWLPSGSTTAINNSANGFLSGGKSFTKGSILNPSLVV